MSVRELFDTEDHVTGAAIDSCSTQVVAAGSVLLVVRSGILARLVPIAIARRPVALNQDMKALLPSNAILPDFLAYALESQRHTILNSYVKRGATVHSLDITKLRHLPVPVPPLREQHRIVEILDEADRLRKLRAAADETAKRVFPSLFIKMFGDPQRNPNSWPVREFRTVLLDDPRNGLSPSAKGCVSGRVLTLSAVTGARFDEGAVKRAVFEHEPAQNKHVDERDFLICRGNGSLKFVGRGRFPTSSLGGAIFPDTIIAARVDPEKVDRYFLETLWESPHIRAEIEGKARTTSGIHKINQSMIAQLEIPLPPIKLQRQFGEFAATWPRALANRSREIIDNVFEILLSRHFAVDFRAQDHPDGLHGSTEEERSGVGRSSEAK